MSCWRKSYAYSSPLSHCFAQQLNSSYCFRKSNYTLVYTMLVLLSSCFGTVVRKQTKLLLVVLKLELFFFLNNNYIVLLSCCMFVTLYYFSINLTFYTQTCSLFWDMFFEVMICVKILPPLHIYWNLAV